VLTVAADTTARLWEAETRIPIVPGKLLASFQHNDVVNSAIFSPNGQRVLTASQDKTARPWEVEGGKLLATEDCERICDALPDARTAARIGQHNHSGSIGVLKRDARA
jgi:WD40 repeat protein